MRRFLVFAAALLAAPLFADEKPAVPETLTNQQVIQLVKSGTTPDDLVAAIQSAPKVSFHLMPADMDELLKAGVSEDAIKAMAVRQNGPTLASVAAPIATGPKDEEFWAQDTDNTAGAMFRLLGLGLGGWRIPYLPPVVRTPAHLLVRPAGARLPQPAAKDRPKK
jgi:hypothetical protein